MASLRPAGNPGSAGAVRARAAMATALALVLGVSALLAGCQATKETRPSEARAGPLIVAPAACADITVSVYFPTGSAGIDRGGDALLAAAGDRARRCFVTGVRVRGLADRPGDPAANLALSRHRAEAVTAALRRHGFTQVEFQVTAMGDAPVDPQADGRALRRRVDVEIHLAPR